MFMFLRDGCSIWVDLLWNIFDKILYFRCIPFKLKILSCYYLIVIIFIHFYIVFVLDSHKISSVWNSRLQGPRWRARSHFVLEYNNENEIY